MAVYARNLYGKKKNPAAARNAAGAAASNAVRTKFKPLKKSALAVLLQARVRVRFVRGVGYLGLSTVYKIVYLTQTEYEDS